MTADANNDLRLAIARREHSALLDRRDLRIAGGQLRHASQVLHAAVGVVPCDDQVHLTARAVQVELRGIDLDLLWRADHDRFQPAFGSQGRWC